MGIVQTLNDLLETIAVFTATALISFLGTFYAVIYQKLPLLIVSTVVTFDQLFSALVYALLIGAVVTAVYRWRRH
jgi:hypothetical protein